MASQSSKKLAQANTTTLNQLHIISGVINVLTLLIVYFVQRPKNYKPWVLFSLPSWFFQYTIEKSGRPTYHNNKLIRSGEDIHHEGLYEYFFDVIYVTWLLDILMVIFGTNYVWLLYLVIPGYAGYKLFGFAAPFLRKSKPAASAAAANSGPDDSTTDSGKTKRQAKLEARREKGPATRYR
ncbi:uncharacterized protein RJT20DRAFT_27328 [Scheffersomyces xylosifermentans]|uniref:uncharacterized protein n=1 Tax=Scheffersomyces xylosifermentans TaxID=1304137 RepID=UPI00315CD2F4